MRGPRTLVERFWPRVNKDGQIPPHCPELGACWEWDTGRNKQGYGVIGIGKVVHLAHRVSWALEHGRIDPPETYVLHRCDNPPCVNPAHLFLGNQKANMSDAKAKGRVATGEKCNAKLDAASVLVIRQRADSGESRASIAAAFGISPSAVGFIVQRKRWSHLAEQG